MRYDLQFKKLPKELKKLKIIEFRKFSPVRYTLSEANTLYQQGIDQLTLVKGELKLIIRDIETNEKFVFELETQGKESLSESISNNIFEEIRRLIKAEADQKEIDELETIENAIALEFVEKLQIRVPEAKTDTFDLGQEEKSNLSVSVVKEIEEDEYIPDYLIQDNEDIEDIQERPMTIPEEISNNEDILPLDNTESSFVSHEPIEKISHTGSKLEVFELQSYVEIADVKAIDDAEKLLAELKEKVAQDTGYMIQKLRLHSDDFISQKKLEFVKSYYSTGDLKSVIAYLEEQISKLKHSRVLELSEQFMKNQNMAEVVEEKVSAFKNEYELNLEEKKQLKLAEMEQGLKSKENELEIRYEKEEEVLKARFKKDIENLAQRHSLEKRTMLDRYKQAKKKAEADITQNNALKVSEAIKEVRAEELQILQKERNENLVQYRLLADEQLNIALMQVIQEAREKETKFIEDFSLKVQGEQESFEAAYESYQKELENMQKEKELKQNDKKLEIEKEQNELTRKQLERSTHLDQNAEDVIYQYTQLQKKLLLERETQQLENIQFQNKLMEQVGQLKQGNGQENGYPEAVELEVSKLKRFLISLGIFVIISTVTISVFLTYAQIHRHNTTQQELLEQKESLENELSSQKDFREELKVQLEEWLGNRTDIHENARNKKYDILYQAILEGDYEAIIAAYEELGESDRLSLDDTQRNQVALAYLKQGNLEKSQEVLLARAAEAE